jgi:hypothetical protein
MKKIALLSLLSLALVSCGGGSGGSSGILIEGQLTQGGSVSHSLLRHSAGQHIGEVEICALGECSVTDSEGQFGFLTPASYKGGEILLTVNGHGINTTVVADIPEVENDVNLQLVNNSGVVTVAQMLVDGLDASGISEEHEDPHGSGHSEEEHSH